MNLSAIDSLWTMICVALVFAMQGGFLCLESGLTRTKDAINVALKNMADFSVALLLYWAFGFAWMFGNSWAGWIGTSNFFVAFDQNSSHMGTIFLFQVMFCATAATIISGAVAGRMRFAAYVITTVIVSGFVYPLLGHWAWGGLMGGMRGWLAEWGFVDFAGSTVVHSVGGWAALAAIMVIGPRTGRFGPEKTADATIGSSVPMAMLGTLLLWMGWIGFNGGSTLAFNDRVAGIVMNTMLAGSAGMLCAAAASSLILGHTCASQVINGSLAGLVAVTASCHAVTPVDAVLIGAMGALAMMTVQCALQCCRIDDAVGAVPVHLGGGVWGTVAVAFFGDRELLGTGLSHLAQLNVQLIGIGTAAMLAFGATYLLLRAVHTIYPLRVTPQQEQLGMNIVEHGAPTELYKLLMEMQLQQHTGDFSRKVHVEHGSDVGQIAAQYNQVLERVNWEAQKANLMARSAADSKRDTELAYRELQYTVADLKQFNELAEGRELRMMELKAEINQLSRKLGQEARYEPAQQDAVPSAETEGTT